MNATNPYQRDDRDVVRTRRSLVVIVSAGLGSILALVVLNLLQPSGSAPATEIEVTPAAQVVPVVPVATLPSPTMLPAPSPVPVATAPATTEPFAVAPPTTVPAPTTAPPVVTSPLRPRWFPPNTPDYVRRVVLDNENLDVVAPIGDGTTSYFAVSAAMRTTCGAAVYRVTEGNERELVDGAAFLFPRNDGRWLVITNYTADNCRPDALTIVDTFNGTSQRMAANGWFNSWSTAHARFVTYDYQAGLFTLYDAPSATSLGLGVDPSFAFELDERVGPLPPGRPGWVIGRVVFLADGDLLAHIQCQSEACAKNDKISGWFYVVDGQVEGESARVPLDKAPPLTFYCGV